MSMKEAGACSQCVYPYVRACVCANMRDHTWQAFKCIVLRDIVNTGLAVSHESALCLQLMQTVFSSYR